MCDLHCLLSHQTSLVSRHMLVELQIPLKTQVFARDTTTHWCEDEATCKPGKKIKRGNVIADNFTIIRINTLNTKSCIKNGSQKFYANHSYIGNSY